MKMTYQQISETLQKAIQGQLSLYNLLAWGIGILLFSLVVIKGMTIPITHDESSQILFYAKMSLHEILAYTPPWPTNHILNSILIKITSFIGGTNQFTGRLPNFLVFIIFYVYSVRWAQLFFKQRMVGLLVAVSVLALNPFLFDFFSLARGYGLALAFQVMALFHLYKFLRDEEERDATMVHIALFFMVMSNFSWLIMWLVIEMMMFLNNWNRRWKSVIYQFIGAGFVVGFSAMPIIQMNRSNQFEYWGSNGLVQDTLLPLWQNFLYSLEPTQKYLIYFLAFFVVSQAFLLFRSFRKESRSEKLWIFPLILLSCLIVSKIQFLVLQTPYLTGRTALLYYPLFSLCILAAIYSISQWKLPFTAASAGLSLVFAVFMFKNYETQSVKEWRYDRYTFEVLDLLKQEHEKTKSDITLDCNWLFHPSLNFYAETDKSLQWLKLIPYHQQADFSKKYPYYYTHEGEFTHMRDLGCSDFWIEGWHGIFHCTE